MKHLCLLLPVVLLASCASPTKPAATPSPVTPTMQIPKAVSPVDTVPLQDRVILQNRTIAQITRQADALASQAERASFLQQELDAVMSARIAEGAANADQLQEIQVVVEKQRQVREEQAITIAEQQATIEELTGQNDELQLITGDLQSQVEAVQRQNGDLIEALQEANRRITSLSQARQEEAQQALAWRDEADASKDKLADTQAKLWWWRVAACGVGALVGIFVLWKVAKLHPALRRAAPF